MTTAREKMEERPWSPPQTLPSFRLPWRFEGWAPWAEDELFGWRTGHDDWDDDDDESEDNEEGVFVPQSTKRNRVSDRTRATLMHRSIAALQLDDDNGEASLDVMRTLLDQGEYGGAQTVVSGIKPSPSCRYHMAVAELFEHPAAWPNVTERFVSECERQVLAGRPCISGIGSAGEETGGKIHNTDFRSAALARLGEYRFFATSAATAIALWQQADQAYEVDEVLIAMIGLITEYLPRRRASARSLAKMVNTKTLQPQARAAAEAPSSAAIEDSF